MIELRADALVDAPPMTLRVDQRMQRVGADGGAPERHAGRAEAIAVAHDEFRLVDSLQAGGHDPRGDVVGRTCHGPDTPLLSALSLG
jgi:hypothetical protein